MLGIWQGASWRRFLLLAVHAEHRHPGGQGRGDGVVDVAELGIAVRVLGAFQGLGVGLQAVAGLVQQSNA